MPCHVAVAQANGHKLRGLQVPDTAVIDKHVLKAWYYTEKQTGVLHATPSSQLSTAALLHKLTGQHPAYERSNPNGLVAVAYFANCITRLVNAKELQQLVSASAEAQQQRRMPHAHRICRARANGFLQKAAGHTPLPQLRCQEESKPIALKRQEAHMGRATPQLLPWGHGCPAAALTHARAVQNDKHVAH